jgi:quercetin dioxygenase-like cupin family protein
VQGRTLLAGALVLLGASNITTADEVAKQGQSSTTKLEHVAAGHLADLNGKYKLRVTEVRYVPGGSIGEHHHAGPGIRCLTAGELTYVQSDKTTVYHSGDCFFESGDVSHTAENRGREPVVLLSFEVLPVDWSGSSAIPVPKKQ